MVPSTVSGDDDEEVGFSVDEVGGVAVNVGVAGDVRDEP